MTVTEQLLAHNSDYVAQFRKGDLPLPPAKKVAVLACMDARLDPARALGLEEGDAHVIRNAGGVASEDAIRSLVISQRLLGTEEIILIHHSDCGMETFDDDAVKGAIEDETGIRPSFALEAFPDAAADVLQTIDRIKASPFIPRKDNIRGFVYQVENRQTERGRGDIVSQHPAQWCLPAAARRAARARREGMRTPEGWAWFDRRRRSVGRLFLADRHPFNQVRPRRQTLPAVGAFRVVTSRIDLHGGAARASPQRLRIFPPWPYGP